MADYHHFFLLLQANGFKAYIPLLFTVCSDEVFCLDRLAGIIPGLFCKVRAGRWSGVVWES